MKHFSASDRIVARLLDGALGIVSLAPCFTEAEKQTFVHNMMIFVGQADEQERKLLMAIIDYVNLWSEG
jgi:hypothetical protein